MKKTILLFLNFTIISIFLVQCSDNKKDTSAGKRADYLFIDGKVYTVNKDQPRAQAVAVKGKEILFVGDKAIHEALNAFETSKKANPESTNRYTVAHNQMIMDSDLPSYREIGVIAQCTPYWFFYLDEGAEGSKIDSEPTGDRANKYNRFRSVQKYGGLLTFGSDFPATGSLIGMHPLTNIEIGITRKPIGVKNAPTTPPAEETLFLETMIEGYTINAAYQIRLEKETGSIEPGKKADLVVLEKNLFDLNPSEIHNNKVMMTMMNGIVTFDKNLIN